MKSLSLVTVLFGILLPLGWGHLDALAQDVESHEGALDITQQTFGDEECIQEALGKWLDMDLVIARHCQRHHLNEPTDFGERLTLHIAAMEAWINHHSKGDTHETET